MLLNHPPVKKPQNQTKPKNKLANKSKNKKPAATNLNQTNSRTPPPEEPGQFSPALT